MIVSMSDIFQEGKIYSDDQRKTIYLTPNEPLVYDTNKWIYKTMPTLETWQVDQSAQLSMHHNQGSSHLAFTFPENVTPSVQWLHEIEAQGFELGLMELYAIEASDVNMHDYHGVDVAFVTEETLEDYIKVHRIFAEPYGQDYVEQSVQVIRNQFESEQKCRVIAYKEATPVGIMDLIIGAHTAEIDAFGVVHKYQKQGIGSAMQAFVASSVKDKTIILLADGEDSAKDMYVKQGYTFISYRYQILKENI
ncbi:GNAT family N-acetyltransferase [Staphylococcus caeli]|uniref:Acetyltransferase n=1 Tax=Staphylococcus caeli TaxID=2201815 RepID=A0A1D4KD90_9STAP|nr:GNAT family N-acetyltransferase [Staphylococcus caeli]SCS71862.1 acetyltransferase [Staphylococcus caeli]SCS76985.1 acetyltransferase [Staphylococcus caeli]